MSKKVPKRKAGGDARAKALSPARLKEIGQRAALIRHNTDIPRATHEGVIKLGDTIIPCAVLEGGIRVVSERAVTKALGGKRGGSHWKRQKENPDGADLPVYLSANNLKPFIAEDLRVALKPLQYIPLKGGALAHGLQATVLPKVFHILADASKAGELHASQEPIAAQAELLSRGLGIIGIIGLVDEGTGFQRDRARDALAKILESFVAKELRAWTSTFPVEFYEHIFRLRGWPFNPHRLQRPSVVGTWTNDFVYARLAPGVLDELRRKNPAVDGRRKNKHFQWLTGDVGDPRLRSHLDGVWRLMRGSKTWDEFVKHLNLFYPRLSKTELGFEVEDYSKDELEAMRPITTPEGD